MFDRLLGGRMISNLAREGCLRLLRAAVPSRAGANRPFCVAKRAGVGIRLPRARPRPVDAWRGAVGPDEVSRHALTEGATAGCCSSAGRARPW